ncbi:glycosyltransferase [Rickettsiales bacterium]|nr:glycosyltransferase [Rickettsiales bacterium]
MEKDLGKFLVKNLVVTEHELERATKMRITSGSSLCDILLSEGYVGSYDLYSNVAEFYKTDFADLYKNPCDISLFKESDRDSYFKLKIVPWKQEDGVIFLATCQINDDVKQWAEKKYTDKFKFVITSPFDINDSLMKGFSQQDNEVAREQLYKYDPECSAKNLMKSARGKTISVILFSLILAGIIFPYYGLLSMFVIMNILYVITLGFRSIVFFCGYNEISKKDDKEVSIDDVDLPIYSLLIPLYKESEKTLAKLVKSIRKINYPSSKLDIKLIVESDDFETIDIIKSLKCPRNFEIIPVPYSIPRTKPKACNYALRFAKGEYATIYDAEDVPDPMQIRKALGAFEEFGEVAVCVQSRLNYYNRKENMLTKLFSIEYSTLFDFVLFGLERLGIPMPLGGTSNHFRIEHLRSLYAWDPYNVTEDADLGIRIAQKGWKSKMIKSITMEEAPISLKSWIRQRTRWIKGHMQTYLVHMRRPVKLIRTVGIKGFLGLQLFLGVPTLVFLISPFLWSLWLLIIIGAVELPMIDVVYRAAILYGSFAVLIVGILIHILFAIFAVRYQGWKEMKLAVLLFPFYWILHSFASFRALGQLITRPYYWEKTDHGVTKMTAQTDSSG